MGKHVYQMDDSSITQLCINRWLLVPCVYCPNVMTFTEVPPPAITVLEHSSSSFFLKHLVLWGNPPAGRQFSVWLPCVVVTRPSMCWTLWENVQMEGEWIG